MLKRGDVVRALSGRDRGRCFAVMELKGQCALLCDGKKRPLERPKLKNIKHIESVSATVPEEGMSTNKRLKKSLWTFNCAAASGRDAN